MARGRKKKVVDPVVEVKRKPIASGASVASNVGYHGSVTINYLNNKKIIKTQKIDNTGTIRLFQIIARFLIGQYTKGTIGATDYDKLLPEYIGIGSESIPIPTPTDPLRTSLINEYNLGSRFKLEKTMEIDSSASAVNINFFALIPYSALSGVDYISEIGLFPTILPRSNDMLARITIDQQGSETLKAGIKVEQGLSIQINWQLQIRNI